MTSSLPRTRSTTELRGRGFRPARRVSSSNRRSCGAGDGIRTRDIQLGRLELYQLSYTRLVPTHFLRQLPSRLSFSAPDGGEERIRTFEARGASDLQSDAFGRFATSPLAAAGLPPRTPSVRSASGIAFAMELAEGIEPPTR